MTETIENRFQTLHVWKRRGVRAPHKPMLALWAIGRCLQGKHRLATYDLVDRELKKLLDQFGPHRKCVHTQYPFWRMQKDGIWEVERSCLVGVTSKGDARKRDLKRYQIRAGLTEGDYSALRENPKQALQIAERLVAMHFPVSLHDAVFEATQTAPDSLMGIKDMQGDEWSVTRRRRRDPKFRAKVLEAYGNRCAVCEFAGRLHNDPLAIEAAHIRWHEAKGPAEVENGLALCSLHHSLFDRGAFTVLPELKVIVARVVRGVGVETALRQYHGKSLLAPPGDGFSPPNPKYLAWHKTQVFQSPELGF